MQRSARTVLVQALAALAFLAPGASAQEVVEAPMVILGGVAF